MGRKCDYCGEPTTNGYAVAAHLKKRSNAIYFCKEEKCSRTISDLCKCVNIMNRRLRDGALYPARKKTKKLEAAPSECQRLFSLYEKTWESRLDREAFPHPDYFRDLGIEMI
jgi:hypothetical protein